MSINKNMELPAIRKKYFSPFAIVGVLVLALLIAFFGRIALWEHSYYQEKEGSEREAPSSVVSNTGEGEDYDESEPSEQEVAEYIVAPDKPRYFSIPSLGIHNSRVFEIGVNANGEMGTPYNIHDVGWYVNAAAIGSNGTAIINAHGGDMGYGIFRSLPNIQPGAEIIIEMGDGKIYKYKVVDKTTKKIGDDADQYMSTAFTSPTSGVGSVTLITCTGDWWLNSQTYSDRLFVRATLE